MNENNVLDIEQSDEIIDGSFEDSTVDSPEDSPVDSPVDDSSADMPVLETTVDAPEVVEDGNETVIEFPEYSLDNPLPVYVVETEEHIEERELEVFSETGSYAGTISDTYLEYFRGITEKLSPKDHYVVWRSGQYAYTLAYGENVGYTSGMFVGNCYTVEIYRNSSNYSSDWYVRTGTDSLALETSSLFIYSDLGMFPRLERGLRYGEEMSVLVAFGVATVFLLASRIFDYIVKYVYRR